MNNVSLIGRLTRDTELKHTSSDVAVTTFTVAVDRRFKNANGDRQADFITCVAWRQQAEFISKYFSKGNKIALTGSIQTRKWEDADGHNRTSTEVVVDNVEFVESKAQSSEPPKAWTSSNDEPPFDL